MKEGENCIKIPTKKMKNLLPVIRRSKYKGKRVHARTSLQLWMWLVDLNYNFECDWLIELSDNKVSNNKLSDNNLWSELEEKRRFFKPITIEEIVIFIIKKIIRKLRGEWTFFFQAKEELTILKQLAPNLLPVFCIKHFFF